MRASTFLSPSVDACAASRVGDCGVSLRLLLYHSGINDNAWCSRTEKVPASWLRSKSHAIESGE